jgi:hypothetical protein
MKQSILIIVCIIIFLLVGIFAFANLRSFDSSSNECEPLGGTCYDACPSSYMIHPEGACVDEKICCMPI